jgi:hypothetical protein
MDLEGFSKMMRRGMNPEFQAIIADLRGILQKHSARFEVTADTADHYCLSVKYSPKFKKGFPVAWVRIGKAYVSYHFIPVCLFPALVRGLSKKLQARMQGKSCFNFKIRDGLLFAELDQLTADGFAMARKAGFVSSPDSVDHDLTSARKLISS